MKQYKPVPKIEEISDIQKETAFGAYLMMFATLILTLPLPIINIIAAVIYYFTNKNKGDFVRFHALQSMSSAIFIGIFNIFCITLVAFLFFNNYLLLQDRWIGIIACASIINILYIIISLIAASYAKKGRMYYFPFFGKLSYMTVFHIPDTSKQKNEQENRSPFE